MYIRLYPNSDRVMTRSNNKKLKGMFETKSEMPVKEADENQKSILKYDEDKDELYYEYIDRESE